MLLRLCAGLRPSSTGGKLATNDAAAAAASSSSSSSVVASSTCVRHQCARRLKPYAINPDARRSSVGGRQAPRGTSYRADSHDIVARLCRHSGGVASSRCALAAISGQASVRLRPCGEPKAAHAAGNVSESGIKARLCRVSKQSTQGRDLTSTASTAAAPRGGAIIRTCECHVTPPPPSPSAARTQPPFTQLRPAVGARLRITHRPTQRTRDGGWAPPATAATTRHLAVNMKKRVVEEVQKTSYTCTLPTCGNEHGTGTG